MATVYGDSGNNTLNGTADNDLIYALAGNDTLNGGLGSDSMDGGTGNDRYSVDSTSDTVTENLNAGTDRVDSYVSYTLGANLETLTLRGSSAINGDGNSLDNRIEGNADNNDLSGVAGDDLLYGKSGDDSLSGGDGNDYLNGGNGNDFLVGRNGNDALTGGAGADNFAFNSPTEGIDTITGFNSLEGDKIRVYAGGFDGGLTTTGSLSSDHFTIGSAATDESDRFIYNSSTGGLFFDSDGTGSLGQVQFAKLSPGLSLSSSDIYVIELTFTFSSIGIWYYSNTTYLEPIEIIFP